jgi:hypothetical protein
MIVIPTLHLDQALAAEWFRDNPNRPHFNYVRIYDGDIAGAGVELGNPRDWCPDVLCIDRNGRAWVADGGDGDAGAERWLEVGTADRELASSGTAIKGK